MRSKWGYLNYLNPENHVLLLKAPQPHFLLHQNPGFFKAESCEEYEKSFTLVAAQSFWSTLNPRAAMEVDRASELRRENLESQTSPHLNIERPRLKDPNTQTEKPRTFMPMIWLLVLRYIFFLEILELFTIGQNTQDNNHQGTNRNHWKRIFKRSW